MSESKEHPPDNPESLSLSVQEQIDAICVQFERAWKAGQTPRLEDYLEHVSDKAREPLFQELLRIEVHFRLLRGEKPAADDWLRRFPGREAPIRLLLPGEQPPPAAGQEPPGAEAAEDPVETTVHYQPVAPPRTDRYVPRRFHAKGGIGEVWLAEDTDIGREVALKRLRQGREGAQDRFLAEAQITGQLEHPGIVPVHDLGLDSQGRPFYVMTFIRGRTLKDAIADYHAGSDREPAEVQLGRLLEIFVKVCQATAYAHSRGVIHRDLKPDNVMLGEYGEALVVDWGMAKVQNLPDRPGGPSSVHLSPSGGSSETQAGAVLGTPAYMSPELAEGRAAEADERTDVYLLGGTLYHILTGQLPRRGSSHSEVAELARNVAPTLPHKIKADIPRALEAICLKAMAHRPKDRYANALNLADDVQRYLAGAPVSAYREPLPARAWRWCKRHRRGLVRSLAGAGFLGLAVFATVAIQEHRSRAAAAEQQAKMLQREKEVHQDLEKFQRLVDERQFYTVLTTSAGEQVLEYDLRRGAKAGKEALEVADRLAEAFKEVSLPAEKEVFNEGHHDLLLLLVQAQSRQSPDQDTRQKMHRSLDQAQTLLGPSRSYHRLRALCYRLQGDKELADQEERQGRTIRLPPTALDHFLLAEEARAKADSLLSAKGDEPADQARRERFLNEAINSYNQALRIDPRHFWSHFHLARCYIGLKLYLAAIKSLDTCVALRPDQPWGYSERGLAFGLLESFADGEAELKMALKLDPAFRPALLHRGILALLQEKHEDALKILEPLEEQKLFEAAYLRGVVQLLRGKRDDALKAFTYVVEENPGYSPVYLNRAQVHFLLGDDDKGLTDLNTFLELDRRPKMNLQGPEGHALRGRLLLQMVPNLGADLKVAEKTLRRALAELTRARDRGFRSAGLWDDLGFVQEQLGLWTAAVASYTEALKTADPALKIKVLNKRGWILAQWIKPPQYDLAFKDFTEVLDFAPRDLPEGYPLEIKKAEAHTGRGFVWARRNNAAEAQREAASALQFGAGDYLTLHNVACIYAVLSFNERTDRGPNADLAMNFIRRALELWQRKKTGPNELDLIRQELAFKHLAGREDFRRLIGKEGG